MRNILLGHILCPVDFDESSPAAVSVAGEIARKHNAIVFLVHVLRPAPQGAGVCAEAEIAARTRLGRIGHQKLKAGTGYELLVIAGDPADKILEIAAGLGADLIVMASHGRKGVRQFLLGSVVERVVREASCPVLTIKPRFAGAGDSRKRSKP